MKKKKTLINERYLELKAGIVLKSLSEIKRGKQFDVVVQEERISFLSLCLSSVCVYMMLNLHAKDMQIEVRC